VSETENGFRERWPKLHHIVTVDWPRHRWVMAYRLKMAINAAAGRIAVLVLAAIRRFDHETVSNFAGALMRTVGPWLGEHRVGRANLAAAFPEKSADEIGAILRGVWDNLGRVAAEIAHLDRICSGDPYRRNYVAYPQEQIDRFVRLKNSGRPALIFSAHLANWELPAVIATSEGIKSAVLYRRPNLGAVADAVIALRGSLVGELVPSSLGAPVALARALENGRCVGMLVDQHYGKGVEVTFFGRRCLANPLIAKLAREIECPIYGTRVVRLAGNRFAAEISDEVIPVRGGDGRIDVKGTMQAITDVIEGWVREHPEQWLWVHRRWR
jgi:Kdo2-lipid IVA lauroyltransferase/acyltransferase